MNGTGVFFTWIVCLMLFACGVIWSPIFISAIFDGKEIISATANIATVIAAITASWAVITWKIQFSNTKRYESLERLLEGFSDMDVCRSYLICLKDYCRLWADSNNKEDFKDLEKYKNELESKIIILFARYKFIWASSALFLDSKEETKPEFSPNKIKSAVIDKINIMHEKIKECKTGASEAKIKDVSDSVSSMCDSVHDEFVALHAIGIEYISQQIKISIN
ncbi:MAG: hypothetical protein K2X80_11155 [Pseudomonadaceae bacterium]|nr:hypothetical protein [Pseudomonadaceae bacterium]